MQSTPLVANAPRLMMVLGLVLLALTGTRRAEAAEWMAVEIPKVWEAGGSNPYQRSREYCWYRCQVVVPESWAGVSVEVFVEPVDDARDVYWNGRRIGTIGSMPPVYRSGLGGPSRFPVPGESIQFGETNVLAIRVYRLDSRGGFSVAAPALFAGEEGMRLVGTWQAFIGENADSVRVATAAPVFTKIQPASEVQQALKLLEQDEGALSPEAALSHLNPAEDLTVELVLSEPEIGQPLSIKFDSRGRLWLVEYLQYPHPAGLTMVSRDMFLRTVYDKVPPPPPNHFRGADRISIHEDTDGDGTFDRHKVFVDGLNMATSMALGRGGVWVLNPPYLLFYSDRDGDDVPDGDPEVLLEGFGLEDSHSIANSLRWGPDGWLYAAQGSTVTGNIRRWGSDDEPVRSLGQLIWRYHPEEKRYEIFAEGGGNAFGVELDAQGRIYSGHNGGNTRGFAYVQGGYFQKGFGKHGELSNPYTFGYFQPMAHHEVPRFTHTFVIYEAETLPSRYFGNLFGVEPLQGRVVYSQVSPDGSSVQTKDLGYVLTSSDPWFRPVDIQTGPDGALYVADFYEQRIDHSSHYQGRVDRESGRVYRLRSQDAAPAVPFDLARLPDRDLSRFLRHRNKWFRQTALQCLADRGSDSVQSILRQMLEQETGQTALEALWALNLCQGFTDEVALGALAHREPSVRAWAVRISCDDNQVSTQFAERLEELARYEPEVHVRSQLACSARRLPAQFSLPIVANLCLHERDAADIQLPLLLWWVIEHHVDSDRSQVLEMVRQPALWNSAVFQQHLGARLMRRLAATGVRRDLLDCVELLRLATGEDQRRTLIKGLEAAYENRALAGLPEELSQALAEAAGDSIVLKFRQGNTGAIQEALVVIADEKAEPRERTQLAELFGQMPREEAIPVLLGVVRSSRDDLLRRTILSALGAYRDEQIAEEVVRVYPNLPPQVREAAQVLLASRRSWTEQFLGAIEAGQIPPESVSPAVVKKLMLHDDPGLRQQVQRHWDWVSADRAGEVDGEIERTMKLLAIGSGNPYQGREHYQALCGVCHTLFDQGGQIGPDLTSYQRQDLRSLLMNMFDPSAEIREGYENYLIETKDDRTLNGFLADQDSRVIVLRGLDGQNMVIARDQVASMKALSVSLMPEGLLQPLSEQQVRDLLAYLRSSQPLPD